MRLPVVGQIEILHRCHRDHRERLIVAVIGRVRNPIQD
jgi:hypothetical protein